MINLHEIYNLRELSLNKWDYDIITLTIVMAIKTYIQ